MARPGPGKSSPIPGATAATRSACARRVASDASATPAFSLIVTAPIVSTRGSDPSRAFSGFRLILPTQPLPLWIDEMRADHFDLGFHVVQRVNHPQPFPHAFMPGHEQTHNRALQMPDAGHQSAAGPYIDHSHDIDPLVSKIGRRAQTIVVVGKYRDPQAPPSPRS